MKTTSNVQSLQSDSTTRHQRRRRKTPAARRLRENNRRAAARLPSGSQRTGVSGVPSNSEDGGLDTQTLLNALMAFKRGDFSVRLPHDWYGINGKIAEAFNEVAELMERSNEEINQINRLVGQQGRINQRIPRAGLRGSWAEQVDAINDLISCLVQPTSETARVIGAVAKGDLSQTMALEIEGRKLQGEFLHTAKTVNTMVTQLGSFASEVTRVAREVGTEGKLGGQARVKGVAGTWKDLTDNVNLMAGNLTGQVRNIAKVATAIAKGDLSKKITVDVKGEFYDLKATINTMVDQLRSFGSEVTRVAREVGTEGKLGGQARVEGVSGTWKDLTDNVNSMARNLTSQVRNIAAVTTAVANGDLSKKITVTVKGEMLELKNTVNTMVDQLSSFAAEVTRVAREVGTEGKLGGQAHVKGVAGTWKDLTDNVNSMASNLTVQLRDVSKVATAIANGDLTQKITVDVSGEILQIKNVINKMVDQLGSFGSEVTRVAREVGTEGKLGGQAHVKGVAGTWKRLTDSVNSMARNLTAQVRNIADVTTAVAKGDLSKKITVDVQGEILELKNTVNTMVDQLSSFASEVTRVAREVGTEGKLGGQAEVRGVSGTWKDLTDNVNSMGGNLTAQVRNIAEVTKAVANGDLSKKITVNVQGEILELKNTVNTMVDQLSSFASEVTRVAREVGTEGKLGGQAEVKGVAGTWKDLTYRVNSMASNLTAQVRNIAAVTTAVANGDLSKKITADVRGEILELKETINTMVDQLRSFAAEVTRVAREVGTKGKLGGQAEVKGVAGTWKDLTDNVNSMASNLTAQVRNIAEVTKAVAYGDLSKKITVDVQGEILELKDTVNTMVDQLSSFASEVTRVAREVGTEGKLGGQANVKGVSGTWKDLTDNVNFMAGNLTSQVRGIAKVVTAVANGDLKRKLTVEAKGEIAALADTINGMTETLATFADQVTTVAREVGVEGKLGWQASVPGAAGTWKDLTDNVNQLAANLTTQVRAIAEVATAVTKGDLTRSIQVKAQGEVAALKDNINEMIRNLKDTTQKNSEQDWLKTNLAKFSRMLQGQKDILTVGRLILSELAPVVSAQQGVFYIMDSASKEDEESYLKLLTSYAYRERKQFSIQFKMGESLVGQCALEKERILLTNVPEDYIQISSGLGEARPKNIIVLPILFEGQVKAVMELASFESFSPTHLAFLDQLAESIGIVLNTIETNMRTEDLLKQSQSLAKELQSQQMEMQQTNEELEEKARLLVLQKEEVEKKNREVEQARQALEEKASQLALTSKYKSEFLANMSHELRTPLNSLLILADQMAGNHEGNLSQKQVEFCQTIRASGHDLLRLINDILDLTKIESGTVSIDVSEVSFSDLKDYVERTFRHVAESKKLEFTIERESGLPEGLYTDSQRLEQVLRNLLSNAFKFTEKGGVHFTLARAREGWSPERELLNRAETVIAFSVRDSGIGIPPEKQQVIFEAFQQADGSTTRNYGGTGLGLAISREIAGLLGGELRLTSEPGRGSTFTLFLPYSYPYRQGQGQGRSESSGSGSDPKPAPAARRIPQTVEESTSVSVVTTAGNVGEAAERKVLIIENDSHYARTLMEAAHKKGLTGLLASRGANALSMVRETMPDAILLNVHLPDGDGWSVLDRIKLDLTTRHIPVYLIVGNEEEQAGLTKGADQLLKKSFSDQELERFFDRLKNVIERTSKRVLVIEPDPACQKQIEEWVSFNGVEIDRVESLSDVVDEVKNRPVDCLILSPDLVNKEGWELLNALARQSEETTVPVIVYATRELTGEEENAVQSLTDSLKVRVVRSVEGLLDETTFILHQNVARLPETQHRMLQHLHQASLEDKKVMIVDDDIRNIFAMTSVLEMFKMQVVSEENGQDAINRLRQEPDIDVILMDIMLPAMDGYDTIKAIRNLSGYESLPIIAITAKAMKADREKCLDAGASDYIPKPVDSELLRSILHFWLQR